MAQGIDEDWLRPEILVDGAQSDAGPPSASFELRPLSLGEVLDRTFALYRSRFWLFASIAAVSASVQVVVQAISLTTAHALMRNLIPQTVTLRNGQGSPGLHLLASHPPTVGVHPIYTHGFLAAQIGTWVAGLLFFLVSAVTQAATSLAMSEVYLQQPASAKTALAVAVRRWYRWIGIAFWQAGSMLWVPMVALIPGLILLGLGTRSANPALSVVGGVLLFVAVVAGFPVGFILYLRNALAVPAAMVEKLTIRPAMRRSKVLAAGTKGRIFVVLLIAGCLYWVVAVLESPASLLILLAPHKEHYFAQALTLVISFLGHTLVAPVALIGLTLVYFDQRVRKEALDLQLLLEGSRIPGASAGPGSGNFAPKPGTPEGLAPLG